MFVSDQRRKKTDMCKKEGHSLNGPVRASAFEAIENVRSDTCAFMGCAAVLHELQILSRPLSEKRRAKC